jgi:uncharacterized coiled-coil protein SlyX
MLEIIAEYAAIWALSITAVLGIVASVLIAMAKIKSAVHTIKDEKTIQELNSKLETQLTDNKILREQVDLLLDRITKIENYRENLK